MQMESTSEINCETKEMLRSETQTGDYNHVLDSETESQEHSSKCTDRDDTSHFSSSSALYSLSDISLSCSSTCSDKDLASRSHDADDNSAGASTFATASFQSFGFLEFLPPSKFESTKATDTDPTDTPLSSLDFLDFQPRSMTTNDDSCDQLPDEGFCGDPSIDQPLWPSSSSHSVLSSCRNINSLTLSLSFDLNMEVMKEKLSAQKEYLQGAFHKQTLPQALSTHPKADKVVNLKMKEKLNKISRAARRFIHTKILRREQTAQRCEIQLDGSIDSIERIILVVSTTGAVSENVNVFIPAYFETRRVVLPKCMLPKRGGGRMTVYVYGVTSKENNRCLDSFAQVLLSGVCILHFGSSTVNGRLELQPHRPYHSLMVHKKILQSAGISQVFSYSGPDSYTFSTQPKPIATEFTELCVLQAAEPFCEYFAISMSTCDVPASFPAKLPEGRYHAACTYRLANDSQAGTYLMASAAPGIFFKTYCTRVAVKEDMNRLIESSKHGGPKDPVLTTSLVLLKLPSFDWEGFLATLHKSCRGQQAGSTLDSTSLPASGLLFCAWNINSSSPDAYSKSDKGDCTFVGIDKCKGAKVCDNPRHPSSSGDFVLVPALSIFSINTKLYFADSWRYYGRQFATLVLCPKGSPCHQLCKRQYRKLDPYDNPFLFRRRTCDPEPSMAVYASAWANVEVIYCDSFDVQQVVSSSSEQVYFSKVRVSSLLQ